MTKRTKRKRTLCFTISWPRRTNPSFYYWRRGTPISSPTRAFVVCSTTTYHSQIISRSQKMSRWYLFSCWRWCLSISRRCFPLKCHTFIGTGCCRTTWRESWNSVASIWGWWIRRSKRTWKLNRLKLRRKLKQLSLKMIRKWRNNHPLSKERTRKLTKALKRLKWTSTRSKTAKTTNKKRKGEFIKSWPKRNMRQNSLGRR